MTGPTAADLQESRARTLALVDGLSDEELEAVHSPLMSPLVWDLGHIAAFEDLWVSHRFGGLPLLREDLAEVYDAFETPRAGRGRLPFLKTSGAFEYLDAVHDRTLALLEQRGADEVHELVLRHEQQHNETMLQTQQLAHLSGSLPEADRRGDASRADGGGFELVEIPAGPCTIGAPPQGFAYDNERPLHRTDVRGYRIGRTPVTNASYLTFVEGGGYERREWWSHEGWAWKEQYDITRPGCWTEDLRSQWRLDRLEPIDEREPVVHVSWFEADAFARAHGARLPTELEWEKAATWDQDLGAARALPWGNGPTAPGVHANVDQCGGGPEPVDAHPDGVSPYGCAGMIGDVWEWTSSEFTGYPGFEPHPYPEYSEVFFESGYKVLRGGSWASRPRVVSATFRNWDLPQRRQIFSGFRIAKDVEER